MKPIHAEQTNQVYLGAREQTETFTVDDESLIVTFLVAPKKKKTGLQ